MASGVPTGGERRLEEVERLLGRARIAGAAICAIQFGLFTDYRPGVRPAALLVGVGLLALGLVTLRLTRQPAPGTIRRLATVTLSLDVVLLVGLELILAYETSAANKLILIILMFEAAMKSGSRGALAMIPVVAVEEALFAGMRTWVYHVPLQVAEMTATFFVASLGAVFAGRTADISFRATALAEAVAAEAHAARQDVTRVYEALRSGIEGLDVDALGPVLATVCQRLGAQAGHLILRRDGTIALVTSFGEARDVAEEQIRLAAERAGPDAVQVGDHTIVGLATGDDELSAVLMLDGVRDPSALGPVVDNVGIVLRAWHALQRESAMAARIRELDRVRSDFLAMASHELRTPLNNLAGACATMSRLDEMPGVTLDMLLDIMARNVDRLARLISQLDTISAIDAGEFLVRTEPARLDRVVADIADEQGIDLPAVAPVLVAADAAALRAVVEHLVSNAVEHGEPPVDVSVSERGGRVRILVRDHGNGVPLDQRALIFERFRHGHDVLSHQRGTGLGLPIARELAGMLGGELVLADPQPERGAAFVLTLPAADRAPSSARARG